MNAVHILNYYEDKTDQELTLLIPFLKLLSQVLDIIKNFSFKMLDQFMNGYLSMLTLINLNILIIWE